MGQYLSAYPLALLFQAPAFFTPRNFEQFFPNREKRNVYLGGELFVLAYGKCYVQRLPAIVFLYNLLIKIPFA